MERIIGIKDLQNAGLLGLKYTDLDLHDAFLMYWISNKKLNNDRIVLHAGNTMLDIDGYFGRKSSSLCVSENS